MSVCNVMKKDWFFPDTYLPNPSDGISHEAICVLNIGQEDAEIQITLYFEDRDPQNGYFSICKANRTHHIRLDRIVDCNQNPIPADRPYAIWLHSSQPVLCQYTRVDASVPFRAMITAMGL